MDKIYDKCCGIDVHKKLIVVCFRKGNKQEVREFGATTRELLELADWLKEGGCEMAAMESTASYWKPLYNMSGTWNVFRYSQKGWMRQVRYPQSPSQKLRIRKTGNY